MRSKSRASLDRVRGLRYASSFIHYSVHSAARTQILDEAEKTARMFRQLT